MSSGEEFKVTRSSGNVFADMGLPDADDALAKAKVAYVINSLIKERKLTQAKAGEILGLDQANVSRLMCGRLTGFSLDRLFRFLTALGMDVEVTVKPKPNTRARGEMMVQAVA